MVSDYGLLVIEVCCFAYNFCGYAGNNGIIGYIFGYHGTSSHQRMTANDVSADDGSIGTYRGTLLDQRALIMAIGRSIQPRHQHIGEDTTGAEEDIVLYLHPFIYGDIVLDAHTVAYLHIGTDVYILSQRAVLAQGGT